ncbi:DUF6786 family protein [Reichenbachiella sp. MALMAid0571]|uniref:DUF6786 family protein n=1 Tax=Reichenbachiella sp. MALMAid0571 TaxID=3143939 RepID=UPI0032DECEF9
MRLSYHLITTLLIVAVLTGCKTKKTEENKSEVKMENDVKGTFGYDLELLKDHKKVIVLKSKDGMAQVAVCPEYQGRIMTSTAEGTGGYSFGWLNHELIKSGEVLEHFNPIGGEERFWLGPEGGQFSIFFKPESSFDFANWYVPKEIDTESFNTINTTESEVSFEKDMALVNYSNTKFDLSVKRTVRLLDRGQVSDNLNAAISDELKLVGFESENTITNKGENAWTKESGMLSVWILSMLNPSPETTVVVPFKTGDESELGKIVTDDYFGKVPSDRLVVKDGVILFKADGKKRGKIGVSPKRALPILGSYDAQNEVLTVAQFTLKENAMDYVNSMWEIQDHPFVGDAVNSYNDGPLEDGEQMGPFYEIESSSPAAALQSGESLTHTHRTYHFKGNKSELSSLAVSLFGVDLATITTGI